MTIQKDDALYSDLYKASSLCIVFVQVAGSVVAKTKIFESQE